MKKTGFGAVMARLLTVCIAAMSLCLPSAYAEADKTELQALVQENQNKTADEYTADSFAVFETELSDANDVLGDAGAEAAAVDEALDALIKAVEGLVPYRSYPAVLTKDTFVQKGKGDNHGADDILIAKQPFNSSSSTHRLIYLGFDIGDVSEEAAAVKLNLYVTMSGANASYGDTEIHVHTSDQTDWSEGDMKWDNKPAINPEIIATGKPGNINEANPASKPMWFSLDVTEAVFAAKRAGKTEMTFAIGTNDSGSAMLRFPSKENQEMSDKAAMLFSEIGGDKTIGQMMDEDLEGIAIEDYLNDSSADRITQSLKTLPSAGMVNGGNIVWQSSKPEVLDHNGTLVTKPEQDTPVVLTASLTRDGITHKKEFPLVVVMNTEGWTDEDFVRRDLDKLEFSMLTDQNPERIISDITLPEYLYPEGARFTWRASNSEVCQIKDGIASFTPKNERETKLDLIVTGTLGNASIDKKFPITVIRGFAENIVYKYSAGLSATSGNPYQAAGRDFSSYWESDPADAHPSITFAFSKPVKVTSGLFVERGNGIKGYRVSCSLDGAEWQTLYTGRTLGDGVRELCELPIAEAKFFRFTVTEKTTETVALYTAELYEKMIADTQIVEYDLEQLKIPKSVEGNVNLPETGEGGSVITWGTSDSRYITETGAVTRPRNSAVTVTLTATARKGSAEASKSFKVKVTPKLVGGNSGGGFTGGFGGGVTSPVSTAKPTPTAEPGQNDKPEGFVFGDVPADFWGYDYIIALTEKGIISRDANFRPEDSVTREEALKLLLLAAGIQPEEQEESKFADVDPNAWYAPYVAAATRSGIILGVDEENFGVGLPVSRQDFAVIAARILEKRGTAGENEAWKAYADADDISAYARSAVGLLNEAGIMNGNDKNEFVPQASATRAEAAKIVYGLYEAIQ